MLHAHRQEPLVIALEEFAVAILRAHPHARGALDPLVDLRYRQAPFLGLLHALARQDLRVDEHLRRIPLLADVDDQEPPVHVHLGRRQADARCGVHGLEHVVDEPSQRGVENLHRRGARAQPRVGKLEYRQLRHGGLIRILKTCTHVIQRTNSALEHVRLVAIEFITASIDHPISAPSGVRYVRPSINEHTPGVPMVRRADSIARP
jgi:hypothetical protein